MTVSGPVRWPFRWTHEGHPRVVVENADPWDRLNIAELLKAEGYQVGVCQGPDLLEWRTCPLAAGERCPLVEEADAVVCGLRLQLPECRAVLNAHAGHGLPVLIETDEVVRRAPFPGTVPVLYDPSRAPLLGGLDAILGHRG